MRVPLLAPVDPRHVVVDTHTTPLPRGRRSELPVVCEAGGDVGASSTGSPAARAPRIDALQPDASADDRADAAIPAAAATAAAATDGLPPVSPPTSAADAACTRAVRDEPPSPRASKWRPRALELFSTARSSRALLIEMYLWATVSLSYYAIGYNAGNLSDQVHLNFLLNFLLISLPLFFSAYASSAAMDHPRIGRCGAAVGYFGLIAVSIGVGAIWPSAATYSSIVGNFAGEAAFNVVYIQGAPLPPSPARLRKRTRARSAGPLAQAPNSSPRSCVPAVSAFAPPPHASARFSPRHSRACSARPRRSRSSRRCAPPPCSPRASACPRRMAMASPSACPARTSSAPRRYIHN